MRYAIPSYLLHVTLLLMAGHGGESRASSGEGNNEGHYWRSYRARAQCHDLWDGLMSGQRPGSGWWQAPDGRWYPPPSPYSQTGAPTSPAGGSEGSRREGPEKGSHSRFGEWVQTTQGIVSIIVGIVALLGGTGAAIAIHGSTTGSHGSTPTIPISPSPSSSSPTPSPTGVFTKSATTQQLTEALLPAQVLGAGATVRSSGADLSDEDALCGNPLPSGAQFTAFETLQDGQTGQYLEEFVIEWDNPEDAATLINDDHAALDQTGSCSAISNGQTIEFDGDDAGSAPQECANGQYVATQASIQSVLLFGFHTSAQCGSYTISVDIFGGVGSTDDQETADGYLNNAVGMLQQTLAQS